MIYDDKEFIGRVIKNARVKAKMTQASLAEKIDMSEKNFGNIENGRQFPAVNNFLRMIDVLNISVEEFGVKLDNIEDDSKRKLIHIILNADPLECHKYLKAINFIGDIEK